MSSRNLDFIKFIMDITQKEYNYLKKIKIALATIFSWFGITNISPFKEKVNSNFIVFLKNQIGKRRFSPPANLHVCNVSKNKKTILNDGHFVLVETWRLGVLHTAPINSPLDCLVRYSYLFVFLLY